MFVVLASPEGYRWAQTTVVRRASRRLCTGRLDGRFGTNLPVSPTVELSSPANFCPSSLVGGVSKDGGWPKCVQLDQGYATVASLDDSTIIFIFRSPSLSIFHMLVKQLHLNGGSLAR